MLKRYILHTIYSVALVLTAVSCAPAAAPTVPPQTPTPKPAMLYVFNTASPHVSVIDTAVNKVVGRKDVPGLKNWGWNDDNNYYDGKNLWLGALDPDTNDAEVLLLDLNSLEVTHRIPLGKEKATLYIGKASKQGLVHVAKHASGQVAFIDAKTYQVREIKDVPVNGGVACDIDTATGPDGVERSFVPTDNGDIVISIDPANGQVLQTLRVPKDTRPFMLTVSPDGRYVWVQERATNGNAILDAKTLEVVTRVPTGKGAIVNTFSPDGKLSYIGHNADSKVTVVDAATFQVVKDIEVGANPQKIAVHPNGKFIYAIVTKENAVAVIDTSTWQVTQRIDLGASPSGIFFKPIS